MSQSKNIISEWFAWHFLAMPKFLAGVWKNYLIFASNYFSLPLLVRSLFSPWRRYRWNYPKGFDIGEFFSTLISNAISRILGAMVRIFLIVFGILFQLAVVAAGVGAILSWLILPFLAIAGILIFLFY